MSHYSNTVKYEIPEEAFANPLNPTALEVYTWAANPVNVKPSNLHGALIVFEDLGVDGDDYKYIWRTIDTGVDFTVLTLKSMPPIQDVRISGEVEVIGPLTDEELRASPLEVTGTIAIDTTGLALETKQDTGNTTLSSILAKIIAEPATEARQETSNDLLGDIKGLDTNVLLTLIDMYNKILTSSTEAKQDEQSALLQTLQSLIETNNNLVQILSPLGSAMSSGQPALRITPTGTTLPVSGTVTATVASTVVSSVTNFGTGVPAKEMADDFNNLLVHMGNITNVTV